MNLSLSQGIFPDSWKMTKIVPLFKGGEKIDVNNYRPVSLLPLPGKLLEKIVHSRIMAFLDSHGILNDNQDGFRPGHATISTVAKLTDEIFMKWNESCCTLATFVDFRKAFDTVNHGILLQKLYKYGISGNTHKWIKNYLSNRNQCVVANGTVSNKLPIVCGVPQGSVLGPLLFLIYINDIGNRIAHSTVRLYADDAVVYTSAESINETHIKLQSDLANIDVWCRRNQLTVNTSKTKCMLFGSKRFLDVRMLPKITLSGNIIQFVENFKYLGVILDNKLNFRLHAQNIYKLASHKIYVLLKIRPYITEKVASRIYKTKILPYIDYGDIFYMSTTNEVLDKLDKLQYRALRICLGTTYRTPRVELIQRTQIPLLKYRRMAHLRNFMYKRSWDQQYIVSVPGRTRVYDGVTMKTFRANFTSVERSIAWKGAREWNRLEPHLRNVQPLEHFKYLQKCWMKSTISAGEYR